MCRRSATVSLIRLPAMDGVAGLSLKERLLVERLLASALMGSRNCLSPIAGGSEGDGDSDRV